MRTVLSLCAALLVSGCDSPTSPDDRWAVPENITYAAALEVDLSQMNLSDTGLYWQDNVIGPGERMVDLEDVVRIHYTIWLPDGTLVQTTRGGMAEQRSVLLLIPGLAEGVTGMRPGGERKLVIRPELAWPKGNGPIPPITTIVCEVELISIQ